MILCAKRYVEDRHAQGSLAHRVADLVGVGEATVNSVLKDHKERVAAAVAKGLTEDDVTVPDDEPETRARRRDAEVYKDRHMAYVQGRF